MTGLVRESLAVGRPPLRIKLLRWLDIVLVRDAAQIHWLNEREELVRTIDPAESALHAFLHGRIFSDLRFANGEVLPAFLPRASAERTARQRALSDRLEAMRGAPGADRDALARFVAGQQDDQDVGVSVQHWCGRLFGPGYRASDETFSAGKLIAGWVTAPPWRSIAGRASGELERAKEQLASAAQDDTYCVHATSIGTQHITRTLRNLRKLAASARVDTLAPDDVLRACLVVPPALLRTCTRELVVPFLREPLTRRSVVVFLTAQAFKESGDFDVAFMADGWSACPARDVIPEMLRAVWHAARRVDAPRTSPLEKLVWSKLAQRGLA